MAMPSTPNPAKESAAESSRRRLMLRVDPLIRGLLLRLPEPGRPWPDAERKEWMTTLEANLKLVYPNGPIAAPGTVRPPVGG
jgi:hypothetical protein